MKRREMSPMLILLLMMVAALFSGCRSLSDVKGSGKAGGGGSVVIDGETYHLKDLFFKPKEFGSLTFSDEMRERFDTLRKDLQRVTNGEGLVRNFFGRHIFSDMVEFRLVAELPSNATCEMEKQALGAGEKLFACTIGWVTWIVPKYYQKLSLEEKMAAIVHERLHAYAPNQSHAIIMPFIKGLVTFMKLRKRIASGERAKLSDLQAEVLREMHFRAVQLNLSSLYVGDVKKARIHRLGGGFIMPDAKVDESAFIGVTSFIGEGYFGAEVEVLRSVFRKTDRDDRYDLKDGVVVKDSSFYAPVALSRSVKLDGVTVNTWRPGSYRNAAFVIRNKVEIVNTRLVSGQNKALVQNGVSIKDSYIVGHNTLRIESAKVSGCQIRADVVSLKTDCNDIRELAPPTKSLEDPDTTYIK